MNKPVDPSHLPASASVEPWKLTAYALQELSVSDSAEVEHALASDANLRDELQSIQRTLGNVKSVLRFSSLQSEPGLTDEQQRLVEHAIATADSEAIPSHALNRVAIPFYRRKSFVALLASAACIPVAILSLSTWGYLGLKTAQNPGEQPVPTSGFDKSSGDSTTPVAGSSPWNAVPSDVDAPYEEAVLGSTSQASVDTLQEMDSIAVKNGASTSFGSAGPVSGPATSEGWGNIANQSALQDASKSDSGPFMESKEREIIQLVEKSRAPGKAESAKQLAYQGAESSGTTSNGSGASATAGGVEMTSGLGSGGAIGGGAMGGRGMTSGGMTSGGMMGGGEALRQKSKQLADNSGEADSGVLENNFTVTPPSKLGLYESGSQPGGTRRKQNSVSESREALHSFRELPPELHANIKRMPASVETSGDRFDAIPEKPFTSTEEQPVTTFSIDVDTAAYSKIRQTLQQSSTLPSPNMVRIEEMINYFQYAYEGPKNDVPFAADLKIAPCPWNKSHQLVRVGVQAKRIQSEDRPRCNLVFLIDVSGSMNEPNKLPLVQRSLSLLADRVKEGDRVAIVVYAGAAGCVLESTPGTQRERIREAIYNLQAGGSTNGGEGIKLAYSIAKEHFISGGANRVILCTDGDFNVGVTNTDSLVDLVKEQAKENIYLTCLGFGAGNYNDAMMEKVSKDGNGVYGMVDSDREAKKLMVDQLTGTLITVAKDVKLQMDFNPAWVRAYRLIGYEDRQLANADFNNDKKDAGDIGAGHSVTALYEVVPSSLAAPDLTPSGSESKYAKKPDTVDVEKKPAPDGKLDDEWLTLRVRYKQPEASESTKLEFVLKSPSEDAKTQKDRDFQWASSIAEFGLLLRQSKMAPNANWESMIERASSVAEGDEHRTECVELMRTARTLANRESSGR